VLVYERAYVHSSIVSAQQDVSDGRFRAENASSFNPFLRIMEPPGAFLFETTDSK